MWGGATAGLVVAGEVDVEFAEEFAGGGVDDADVVVLDEEQDVGSGVGSADADVAEFPGDAQGHGPGCVDLVGADAVVGVGGSVGARGGFRAGGVGGGRGGAVGQGAVRSVLVVGRDEGVERGRLAGSGVISPWRCRVRWIVGRDTVMPWWWSRCQPMVSAPASRPSGSCVRSFRIRSTVSARVAVGEVCGRRERGCDAASPSAR